jgi:restriction endonuclease XhoI-like protein
MRTALELPRYFSSIKKGDLIVVSEDQLVLAMEFKSHAGKSIGTGVFRVNGPLPTAELRPGPYLIASGVFWSC